MNPLRAPARSGLAVAEVVVAMAIVVVGAALLAVLAGRSRSHGQMSQSLANLKQLGEWTATFGEDNAGKSPGYTWTPQNAPSTFPDLQHPSEHLQAAHFQMVDIIRRRASHPAFPTQGQFFPHILYTHLVLADYAGISLPGEVFRSPADRVRAGWIADPSTAPSERWVYSTSYEETFSFWYAGESQDGGFFRGGGSQSTFTYSPGSLRTVLLLPTQLAMTRFPSQKVYFHDQWQRHVDREIHFFFAQARVLAAMGDGSCALRRTGDCDRGGYTRFNGSRLAAPVDYSPVPWEPPTPPGESAAGLPSRMRFTFRLLAGRDFGPGLP